MNRLEDLLQNLCPDGVEFVPLGQVLDYSQPTPYIVKSTRYEDLYDTPVLTAGASFILGYTDETKGIYVASRDKPVIIFDDFTTSFHWVDFKFKVKSSAMKILTEVKQRPAVLRYIFYAMQCITYQPSNHARQWIQTYSKIQIPLPPLPVQEEIVRILDTFSGVVTELEAEQAARVRQYEHYRNELLSFDSKSKIDGDYGSVRIKDIARRNHGTNITANRMKELHKENGPIRVFAGGSTLADVDYSDIPLKDIINETSVIVKSRGYIGFEYYEKPFSHKNEFWSYTFSKECNPKFYYYFLLTKTDYFQQKARASSVKLPQLSVSDTDNFLVPLPPLEVQNQIVSMLDRFDILVNDLKSGLPAEIALRRKQYEYYRDKLLTFQPLK